MLNSEEHKELIETAKEMRGRDTTYRKIIDELFPHFLEEEEPLIKVGSVLRRKYQSSTYILTKCKINHQIIIWNVTHGTVWGKGAKAEDRVLKIDDVKDQKNFVLNRREFKKLIGTVPITDFGWLTPEDIEADIQSKYEHR